MIAAWPANDHLARVTVRLTASDPRDSLVVGLDMIAATFKLAACIIAIACCTACMGNRIERRPTPPPPQSPPAQPTSGIGGAPSDLKGSWCLLPPGTQRLDPPPECTPAGVIYAHELNVEPRRFTKGFPGIAGRWEWYAIDFRGSFTASRSGTYSFRLLSDDGSLLWIDGTRVIDNDGQHVPISVSGTIQLGSGRHEIRVYYFQAVRTSLALQLFVTPPGQTERLWTPEL